VPGLGPGETQVILLAAVVLASLRLGLGAGLAGSAAGFAWLLWPAAEAGTLDTVTLLKALLWFALAKGTAAAIALPRGQLARILDRLRGTELMARQRGLLLEEMSHRIRNDMQRLTGMLQAQANDDPAAAGGLMRAAGRIQVLGRVHERLAKRSDGSVVDSQVFLEGLADDLRAAMLPDSGVALTASAESHPLPLPVAADLGLVVNELVTNALKYAFPRGRGGVVRIGFSRDGDTYHLSVSDNGVGMGAASPGGSGTRLVAALAGQLGGRVEAHRGEVGGTQWVLRFPVLAAGRPAMRAFPAEARVGPARRTGT
jgi:two-component sensor histidine kinase